MAAYSPEELNIKRRCKRIDKDLKNGLAAPLFEGFHSKDVIEIISARYAALGHLITHEPGITIIHPFRNHLEKVYSRHLSPIPTP